jgi:NADPH-dependent 2,4-dienoyl-CoA reductase/sulfur reductase-like enzyme
VAQNFWDAKPICAINTRLGHYDHRATPVSRRRRVVVLGGGPAGMEAARVAATRGHEVLLIEGHRLGGTALLSSLTTPANGELVRYLRAAILDAGVEVRLGRRAGVEEVVAEHPDVVVVATGAKRRRPHIHGGDLPHVLSGDDLRDLLTGGRLPRGIKPMARLLLRAARVAGFLDEPARLRQLSRRWMPLGRRVVVIGGGLVGVELAEFLAQRGRQVTVLEESPYLGAEMALPRRMRAVYELEKSGVRAERNAKVARIDRDHVTYLQEGEEHHLSVDHVIYASGVEADRSLADAISETGFETFAVGDCAEVGHIQGAIHSAAKVASLI